MGENDHDLLIRLHERADRLGEDFESLKQTVEDNHFMHTRQREKDLKIIDAVTRLQKTFMAVSGGLGIVFGIFADALKHKFGW